MSAVSQTAFVTALLDPQALVPSGVTTARGEQDRLRFAVYRNNVVVSLTKSLAATFPVVERLVGQSFFFGMARSYLETKRPSSPLMFEYGRDFPDFVAAFEPAASLPYLADVARIEAAWIRAYHAEDRPPLGLSDLAAVPPEALATCRLLPHPAATLVASGHSAGSIWHAHQGETVTPVGIRHPEAILVVRPGLEVTVTILPAADAPFAAALMEGRSLGEAAEAAMRDREVDFGRALTGLFGLGAFAGIVAEEGGQDE